MYREPIDIITEGINYEIENGILRATQKVGFNIDTDRLKCALKYDRSQYYKGQLEGLELARMILNDNGCQFGPLDVAIDKYKSDHTVGLATVPDTIIKNYKGQVECKCPNGHNIPMNVRDKRMPYCPFCGVKLNYREKRYDSWKEFREACE